MEGMRIWAWAAATATTGRATGDEWWLKAIYSRCCWLWRRRNNREYWLLTRRRCWAFVAIVVIVVVVIGCCCCWVVTCAACSAENIGKNAMIVVGGGLFFWWVVRHVFEINSKVVFGSVDWSLLSVCEYRRSGRGGVKKFWWCVKCVLRSDDLVLLFWVESESGDWGIGEREFFCGTERAKELWAKIISSCWFLFVLVCFFLLWARLIKCFDRKNKDGTKLGTQTRRFRLD